MYYNDFKDLKLSALGLGCMRLPVIDGDETRPDPAAVQEMVDYAMANGINYYDTAWGYHGGNSESVVKFRQQFGIAVGFGKTDKFFRVRIKCRDIFRFKDLRIAKNIDDFIKILLQTDDADSFHRSNGHGISSFRRCEFYL